MLRYSAGNLCPLPSFARGVNLNPLEVGSEICSCDDKTIPRTPTILEMSGFGHALSSAGLGLSRQSKTLALRRGGQEHCRRCRTGKLCVGGILNLSASQTSLCDQPQQAARGSSGEEFLNLQLLAPEKKTNSFQAFFKDL